MLLVEIDKVTFSHVQRCDSMQAYSACSMQIAPETTQLSILQTCEARPLLMQLHITQVNGVGPLDVVSGPNCQEMRHCGLVCPRLRPSQHTIHQFLLQHTAAPSARFSLKSFMKLKFPTPNETPT